MLVFKEKKKSHTSITCGINHGWFYKKYKNILKMGINLKYKKN
jgi:hypothetical protein